MNKVKSLWSRFAFALALLFTLGTTSYGQAGAVQTAIEGAVTAGKTAADAILVIAAGVIASFILIKLGKRAANKA